jgi:hypothetical protein
VRHHILTLESANLVEVSEIRRTGKVMEKIYRAKADALRDGAGAICSSLSAA